MQLRVIIPKLRTGKSGAVMGARDTLALSDSTASIFSSPQRQKRRKTQ